MSEATAHSSRFTRDSGEVDLAAGRYEDHPRTTRPHRVTLATDHERRTGARLRPAPRAGDLVSVTEEDRLAVTDGVCVRRRHVVDVVQLARDDAAVLHDHVAGDDLPVTRNVRGAAVHGQHVTLLRTAPAPGHMGVPEAGVEARTHVHAGQHRTEPEADVTDVGGVRSCG